MVDHVTHFLDVILKHSTSGGVGYHGCSQVLGILLSLQNEISTHSLIHPLIDSLAHSLTHSLTHTFFLKSSMLTLPSALVGTYTTFSPAT